MSIESLSAIAPFTGLIRPPVLDDMKAQEKYKEIDKKFKAKMDEERESVNPVYNCKGEIINNVRKRYLDIFA